MAGVVTESFITREVLPGETVLSWFKFHKSTEFTFITISYEDKDNAITDFEFKNYLKTIIVEGKGFKRYTTVLRKDLTLDGFFGFTFRFNALPLTDISIPIRIDFFNGNQNIGHVVFKTKIIRPILEIVRPKNIAKEPEMILFGNKGSANAVDVTLYANSTSKDIKTTLKFIERHKDTNQFLKKKMIVRDLVMEITGKGSGFVELIAKYSDEVGNHYKTLLDTTPIDIVPNRLITLPIVGPTSEPSRKANRLDIKTY